MLREFLKEFFSRSGPSTIELDPRFMDGLYWPSDAGWDQYFRLGMDFYAAGGKRAPYGYPDAWPDVMQNQGFLYAQRMDAGNR